MLRGSPFVGVKARRVKREQTLIYLLFQGWVRALAVVFVESSGGKGVFVNVLQVSGWRFETATRNVIPGLADRFCKSSFLFILIFQGSFSVCHMDKKKGGNSSSGLNTATELS